jgi:hypothetical protein
VFICGFISLFLSGRNSHLAFEDLSVSAHQVSRRGGADARGALWATCVEAFVSKIQHEEHKDHEVYSTGEGSSWVGRNDLANPVGFLTFNKNFVIFVSLVIFVLNLSFSYPQWVRGHLDDFSRLLRSQGAEGASLTHPTLATIRLDFSFSKKVI